MQTVVEVTVVSKKESSNYYNKENPKAFEIEFEVPFDQNSVFHKLSGGTNAVLRTVNADAAAMFDIGTKVRWTLEVIPAAETN